MMIKINPAADDPLILNYPKSNSKRLYYDTTPTFKGKCYFCRKSLPKGTPRFWYWANFVDKVKFKKMPDNKINIKRKICFRCIDKLLESMLLGYITEINKIKKFKKKFHRTLKGKKCKRIIENALVLEELEQEAYTKNFDFNGLFIKK